MLVSKGIITQATSNMICRRGTRKENYWGRHLLDLCEFVLDNREVEDKVRNLLEKTIAHCKQLDSLN